MNRILFSLFIFKLIQYDTCYSQPGKLDLTFGGSGYVLTQFGNQILNTTNLVIQPDGKIIALGAAFTAQGSNSNIGRYATELVSIVRYNTNGTLDQNFGSGGKIQLITGIGIYPYSYNGPYPAIQPDGKILFAYTILNSDSNFDYALTRLNTDGSIDTTFGSNGTVQTDYDSTKFDFIYSIVVQPDRRIILGGSAGTTPFLVRYQATGIIDSSFGVNGKVTVPSLFNLRNMTLLPSGQILIRTGSLQLLRLTSDGQIDTTFHSPVYNLPHAEYNISSMASWNDGSIFLGGDTMNLNNNSNTTSFLIKLTPSDSMDTSFNSCGYTFDNILANSSISAIAIASDGSIFVSGSAGYMENINTAYSIYVTKYMQNGSTDSSFGNNGSFIMDTLLVGNTTASAIAIESDGKIVILGNGNSPGFLVLRLLNNLTLGIVKFDCGGDIMQIYPNPIYHRATLSYELVNDERISIGIYGMDGRQVQAIVTNQYKHSGKYTQTIDLNENISAGNYILRIANNNGSSNIKIIAK